MSQAHEYGMFRLQLFHRILSEKLTPRQVARALQDWKSERVLMGGPVPSEAEIHMLWALGDFWRPDGGEGQGRAAAEADAGTAHRADDQGGGASQGALDLGRAASGPVHRGPDGGGGGTAGGGAQGGQSDPGSGGEAEGVGGSFSDGDDWGGGEQDPVLGGQQ